MKIETLNLILETIEEEIRQVKQSINTKYNINRLEYLEKRRLINEKKYAILTYHEDLLRLWNVYGKNN